jgi:hypothetical protein
MWTENGEKMYTTMLQVVDNHVIRYVEPEEWVKTVKGAQWYKPFKGPPKMGVLVVGAESADPRLVGGSADACKKKENEVQHPFGETVFFRIYFPLNDVFMHKNEVLFLTSYKRIHMLINKNDSSIVYENAFFRQKSRIFHS